MRIRLMRPDDLDAAARLVAPGAGVTTRTAFRGGRPWIDGARHLLSVDPGGCWVADEGGRVMGMAMSARRDPLWVLSAYAMEQGQGDGPGAALLEAAVAYGTGCLRGMVCTVSGSAAARLVRLAGFTLHPVMHLRGIVDRNLLPFVDGVREGTETDLELVDSVDRQLRGATHGPDQAVLRASGPLLICDLLTGSGYAYL